MAQKSGSKLNLYQCKMLVANGFLSSDGQRDYQHEEVIDRMWELQARKDERQLVALMRVQAAASDELPPPIPAECDEGYDAQYDWQKELEEMKL